MSVERFGGAGKRENCCGGKFKRGTTGAILGKEPLYPLRFPGVSDSW